MKNRSLITGVTGQDGSYLADLLVQKGYDVHGIYRRSSTGNFKNIEHLIGKITLHRGDVTDPFSLKAIVDSVRPHEIYHEADQDHVDWSFAIPSYSIDVTIKGVMNLLEICRLNLDHQTKIFIPSSATIFGSPDNDTQDEMTLRSPCSPYAVAKSAVLDLAEYYRKIHGLQITTGILYNHDSKRRHGQYLLHRICKMAVECYLGEREFIEIWGKHHTTTVGHAEDYAEIIYRLLGANVPGVYAICLGFPVTLEYMCDTAFKTLGISDGLHRIKEVCSPTKTGHSNLFSKSEKLRSLVEVEQKHSLIGLIQEITYKYLHSQGRHS